MKRGILLLLVVPVLLLVTGCPVGVSFPLGQPGTEKINKDIIGTWSQTDPDKEVLKMEIKKVDEFTIAVKVNEKGSMYSEDVTDFKGYFTEIDGKKFIYLQDATNELASWYSYCYEINGKTLHTWDISLKVGGVDAVTSTEAYRQEVSGSLKFADALSGETVWTKE